MINENNVAEIMAMLIGNDMEIKEKYKNCPKNEETGMSILMDSLSYAAVIKINYPVEDRKEAARRFEEWENNLS